MNLSDEILKTIQIMISRTLRSYKADRTYKSVIKRIVPKGYVILDSAGGERTAQCYIPNVELRVGQSVWVKEPMGNLRELYICSVINKTENKR